MGSADGEPGTRAAGSPSPTDASGGGFGERLRAEATALRTPRAAAVAGIVFSVLLIGALTVLNISAPRDAAVAGSWITVPSRRRAISLALNLVPFAGIAFLWFIGVIRDRVGAREDRFFATVFLGSGLLFVAMLFTAAAVGGGLIAAAHSSTPPPPDTLITARSESHLLLHVYAMRMAAVFTFATATITIRTRIIPRWIAVAGYASGLVLLVSVGFSNWVELLFPAWILILSVAILVLGLRAPPVGASPAVQGDG